MSLDWDLSHDEDRYFSEQEEAATQEAAWWVKHGETVLWMAQTILSNPALPPHYVSEGVINPQALVQLASEIVQEVTSRQVSTL